MNRSNMIIVLGFVVASLILATTMWLQADAPSSQDAIERSLQTADAAPSEADGDFANRSVALNEVRSDASAGHEQGRAASDSNESTRASSAADTARRRRARSRRAPEPGRFHRDELDHAGMAPEEIDRLERLWQSTMGDTPVAPIPLDPSNERRAPREPSLAKKSDAVREELCGQVDAGDCDALLYATGHTNRVAVARVTESSAAWEFGLRPGDEILRIDGRPVYGIFEVKPAMQSTSTGEQIPIEILRDGQPIELWVPGGQQFGAPLRALRSPPQP